MSAGVNNEDTVFLFTDTQIVQEEFLEDINNILNSGRFRSKDYFIVFNKEISDTIFVQEFKRICVLRLQKKILHDYLKCIWTN